jgi:coenzyme F420-reducing hydrogenase gamma subunit
MVEGRCMGCKTQMKMKDPVVSKTARGGFIAKGVCSKCGTKMAAMMSEEKAKAAIAEGAKKGY